MAYNLEHKLKALDFERKQVLKHLNQLDEQISTLRRAIEIMQSENDVTVHNTENFVYRQRYWLFKGRIRKPLLQMFQAEPNHGFTIAELTQRLFDLEQNSNPPTEKHLDSVRKQLNKFYQDGLITRTKIAHNEVHWQWKQK